MTRSGIPDLLCQYRGIAFYIEVKDAEKYKISVIQKAQIKKLRKQGTIAIVANRLEQVMNVTHSIDCALSTSEVSHHLEVAAQWANEEGIKI